MMPMEKLLLLRLTALAGVLVAAFSIMPLAALAQTENYVAPDANGPINPSGAALVNPLPGTKKNQVKIAPIGLVNKLALSYQRVLNGRFSYGADLDCYYPGRNSTLTVITDMLPSGGGGGSAPGGASGGRKSRGGGSLFNFTSANANTYVDQSVKFAPFFRWHPGKEAPAGFYVQGNLIAGYHHAQIQYTELLGSQSIENTDRYFINIGYGFGAGYQLIAKYGITADFGLGLQVYKVPSFLSGKTVNGSEYNTDYNARNWRTLTGLGCPFVPRIDIGYSF